jgi:hypothetical protein
MPTTDLSLVIDPGGSLDRPGINLQVFPSGSSPIDQSFEGAVGRSGAGALVAGGFADITEFTINTVLTASDYRALNALLTWSQQSKKSLNPFEIVVYNLIEPYSELGATRSRYLVPGTIVLDQTELQTDYYQWTYWVALQGLLYFDSVTQMGACYQCQLSFQEGTKLTQSMET